MSDDASLLFYSELARWWPLISAVDHYTDEAAYAVTLMERAQRSVEQVLELGSGGGHNAFHMKSRFQLTLVDLSPQMLAQSQRLNPECTHVCADMRNARLDARFDAVFVHDAVDYMRDEADLSALFRTAWDHCRPGGILVVLPDHVLENFEAGHDSGGSDAADGSGVRYLEWTRGPMRDGRVQTDYAFVTREADGRVRHYHETHETGLFSIATWTRLLEAPGFVVETEIEHTEEAHTPRQVFLAHRPSA